MPMSLYDYALPVVFLIHAGMLLFQYKNQNKSEDCLINCFESETENAKSCHDVWHGLTWTGT